MKSPGAIAALSVLLIATALQAAKVDMRDPRRAVGRENDIRVDAELAQDAVSPNTKLAVTYQIQNLTEGPIAIADKISDASYDSDTQTITLSFGAEVPDGAAMPHLVVIPSGAKKTFRGAGAVRIQTPRVRSPFVPVPHFVQIKVTVLTDLQPFSTLIDQQEKTATTPVLSNEGFDHWVNSVSSVFLNVIPVRWEGRSTVNNGVDAEQSRPGAEF
jgi:hypothetical protein